MLIRAKAPLRLGLAGGGTDVSPYCDMYGGAILNATINLYAYATIEPRTDGKIVLESIDQKQCLEYDSLSSLPIDGTLDLLKGSYNRIVAEFNDSRPLSFKLSTFVDAPPGSGLGSSSTLVVAIVGAFAEWLRLPLGEYDIASLAYQIERKDLAISGGKQDQYAATFGGFNYMEFYDNDKVVVNPLRIKKDIINELEMNLLLYYTGVSRYSSAIIEDQIKNVEEKNTQSLDSMHSLKQQAVLMKEALLRGELNKIGEILDFGWQNKKKMAQSITNPLIEDIYQCAKDSGALGGKISGAGGGGFMMLFVPNTSRYKVMNALSKFGGYFTRFQFVESGLEPWRVKYE